MGTATSEVGLTHLLDSVSHLETMRSAERMLLGELLRSWPGMAAHRDDPTQSRGGDPRQLLRRVLLHLPRFTDTEINDSLVVSREVRRLADQILQVRSGVPTELKAPRPGGIDLGRTILAAVCSETAGIIHRSFHYLGSVRGDGTHFGLYCDGIQDPRELIALATLSPLDVPHLLAALPSDVPAGDALVLSRLFAFEGAPPNTVTHTLGRVFAWLRLRRPQVKVIFTYLNPNLGFTGTVYRASNWLLYGREPKRRYLYMDGDYVTDRQMIARCATADFDKLRAQLGARVSASQRPLHPLEVYVYYLDPTARAHASRSSAVRELVPPSALVGF